MRVTITAVTIQPQPSRSGGERRVVLLWCVASARLTIFLAMHSSLRHLEGQRRDSKNRHELVLQPRFSIY